MVAGLQIFQAPKRLPLKRIVCAYGVNRATEAAHHYSWDADEKVPVLEEIIYEQAQSEHPVLDFQKDLPSDLAYKSGDGTVNYASLAWCKRWLGPVSNITLVPDGDALKGSKTVRCQNCDVSEFAKEHQGKPSNTYYEADTVDEAGDHRFTQVTRTPRLLVKNSYHTIQYDSICLSNSLFGCRFGSLRM